MSQHTQSQPTAAALSRFLPIHAASIIDAPIDIDLYIRYAGQNEPELYHLGDGFTFTQQRHDRLADQGIRVLYTPIKNHVRYRQIASRQLNAAFNDPDLGRTQRAQLVRETCSHMINDVMRVPNSRDALNTVVEVGDTFSKWSQQNEHEFLHLLDMTDHDYYTATHMVNVGIACGLLARRALPNDHAAFHNAVVGGLLHDIGKRNIPDELLNKEGPLDDHDWALIKAHPTDGAQQLLKHNDIPQPVIEIVRDHHEKLDGTGYPNGRTADQISTHARICAIVDVFDSIASARPYRDAIPRARVIEILEEGRNSHFDPKLLDLWLGIVETLAPDAPTTKGTITPSIDDLIARPKADNRHNAANRRHHERHSTTAPGHITIVQPSPNNNRAPGFTATGNAIDISRSGIAFDSPVPFARGDLVTISVRLPNDAWLQQHAVVRHTRRNPDTDRFHIGLQFIEQNADAA